MRAIFLCETDDKKITLTAFVAGVADDMPYNKKRKAVLICPGGAYAYCSNREGEPIATSFLAAGYNAFVLDYSTKNRDMKGKKFPGQLIEAALGQLFRLRYRQTLQFIHPNTAVLHRFFQ